MGEPVATGERWEIAIPKWSGELVFAVVVIVIFGLATVVALLELLFRVAIMLPCIWLAIVAILTWIEYHGRVRERLICLLGVLSQEHFLQCVSNDAGSLDIRYGYRLFGHRLYYFTVPLHKIESLEWAPSQNPALWNVVVWYDHDDLERSLRCKGLRKPDQDPLHIGPSRGKEKIQIVGLAVLEFLRRAGARLVQGKDDRTFVREP